MRRSSARAAAGLLVAGLLADGCAWWRRAPRAPPPTVPSERAEPAVEATGGDTPVGVTAPAAPSAPVPPLPPPAPPYRLPATVRVGLFSDLEAVTLPCCDGEVTAEAGGTVFELVSPITVRPAARADAGTVWRLQAAALRDEGPASMLATRLALRTGERTDFRFDAGSGLYRVRLGGWTTREEADSAARRFKPLGLYAAWIVSEGGGIVAPALELIQRDRRARIEGRTFRARAPDGGGLRVEGRRYRGTIELFLNDRGRLNVVNELSLEEYLRGVVPRELGPIAHPEIEGLKAQAVAARSYTLANLGGFAEEGYDLCGTPQCQVYGGMDDEHPLSDRAVAETAGEILVYGGRPAETLYSATCGGHTENVEHVFPLKTAAYLRGVPCIESGGVRLHTERGVGASWPGALLARFRSPEASSSPVREVEETLVSLVAAAGLTAADDRLSSLERREVQRFLSSQLDLAADARLFVRPEELDYLVADPPADWSEDDRRFAAWLVKGGFSSTTATATPIGVGEARDLLLQVALFLGVIEERIATFSTLREGQLVVRAGAIDESYPLERDLATFRQEGVQLRGADLLVVPGDDVRLYLDGSRLVAVVQEVNAQGTAYDRTHPRSGWKRFKTDEEISASVQTRFPGFDIRDFELLERGVSGRVGRLRMRGAHGETIDVEGLAVRWTLDLPDTFFTARRLELDSGKKGWQFTGRGWGHGVGMCQLGAVGMARRGHDYRSILAHYYLGAKLERFAAAPVDLRQAVKAGSSEK